MGRRVCSLYRFTDVDTFEIPKVCVKMGKATDDWRSIKNAAHGRTMIKTAHAEASAKQQVHPEQNTAGDQKSKLIGSKSEAKAHSNASKNGQERVPTLQKKKLMLVT